MNEAAHLFESTLDWLCDSYDDFLFRNENDVVTVLWARMVKMAKSQGLPYDIDYERSYPMSSWRRQCDIVICGASGKPLVCIEMKYEPARTRPDIVKRQPKIGRLRYLLPGHGLTDWVCDIERLPMYVQEVGAEVSYAAFIDEDSFHHSGRDDVHLPGGTSWIKWGPKTPEGFKTAVMVSRFPSVTPTEG
jgi:hypothetical protein